MLVVSVVASVVVYVVVAIALAGVFRKAGEPAWQAFVPVLNTLVLLRVAGRPLWWFLLLLVPVLNVVVLVVVWNDVSRSFGRGPGFTVGLVLLPVVFLYVLWLGDSTYRGPAAAQPAVAPAVA
ncbi:DUF5684 domain-containing protein [Cellulomonas sp.]|uniref:DUF5684 domain-containing protein n=1 Tax=Cellulomonas sp. TaxID=40001 RepID=UPI002811718E|nr:DUF5684 domain-containing protein [Cellulomonas sp.]